MARTKTRPTRYRSQVALRALAASLGGFVFASALTWLLAELLVHAGAAARPTAVGLCTQLSFAVWCAVGMWVFHTASVARAWVALVLPSALIALAAGWR